MTTPDAVKALVIAQVVQKLSQAPIESDIVGYVPSIRVYLIKFGIALFKDIPIAEQLKWHSLGWIESTVVAYLVQVIDAVEYLVVVGGSFNGKGLGIGVS